MGKTRGYDWLAKKVIISSILGVFCTLVTLNRVITQIEYEKINITHRIGSVLRGSF